MSAPVQPYGKVRRDIANTLGFKAVGILSVITANINLHTNEFRCSLSALADLCQTSIPTVTKYVSILESAGLIRVSRSGGGSHHEVNVYHLAGKHADTALMPIKTDDASTKEVLPHALNNFTPGVKKLYTDYIDSLDSISEEEDTFEFDDLSESDSGEHPTAGEGIDKSIDEQDSALTQLEKLGITGTALEAAKLYPERIPLALALSAGENVRDRRSYAARVLMNGTYDNPGEKTKQDPKYPKISQFDGISWSDLDSTPTQDFDDTPQITPDSDRLTADLSAPSTDLSPLTTDYSWSAAYNQLELQLDTASFQTWLGQAQFIRINPDGTYIVAVHNSYARDMLQYRLYRNVKRALSDVLGKPAEIQFILQSEANTS